jgi:uncharacterized protein YgiM (DUF1202 family)
MMPRTNVRYRIVFIIVASLLFLFGSIWTAAQSVEVSDAMCSPALNAIWTTASNACVGKPAGFICNGGSAPLVEPAGPVSSALSAVGALVEVAAVDAIHTHAMTLANNHGGVAWVRLPALTVLLVGNVSVRDVSPPDFSAWQSMIVQTGADAPVCGIAPRNAFVAQTPVDQTINFVVNGASVVMNGTILVQTSDSQTLFISLSGQARILARGMEQALLTGEEISVPYNPGDFAAPAGPPSLPQPFNVTLSQNLPVALLDRPLLLPQPGYVATAGQVNMRTDPSTDAALVAQVPAGQVMSVLGRNTAGDWYHVQLNTGETGWMYAQLLRQNLGSIQAIYDATPIPPQRYGALGQIATVIAPAGLNLRQAPDVSFGLVVTIPAGTQVNLLARSPYSPWVKVEAGGIIGWAALITLETQSVIEALPIDYDVPPPPEPTRVPGSFGNAFPDPNRDGN